MTLDPFITFRQKERFLIASTHSPFFIGEIIRSKQPPQGEHVYGVVGYDIWIKFVGAMDRNMVPLTVHLRDMMGATVIAMTNFYLRERILPALDKFRKLETVV